MGRPGRYPVTTMRKGEVQVFVDDYVLGRLPEVCVVSGRQTTDRVQLRTNVTPLNWAWFLLLALGPLGAIALLIVAWTGNEYITGWMPYSHERFRHLKAQKRFVVVGSLIGGVGFVALAVALDSGVFFALVGLIVVAAMMILYKLGGDEPRVELDGTKRWVTIRNAHPAFVASFADRSTPPQERSLPLL